MKSNKLRKIINAVAIFLIVYQFVSWFAMGIVFKEGEEHPMSNIKDFIVDDNGNVIISEGFYSVIQVFDKNGKFITSWYPNSRNYNLSLGEKDVIIIDKDVSDRRYFELNGSEIKNKQFSVSPNNVKNEKDYRLTGGIFFPKIIKLVEGKEIVIVKQSFFLNITKAPFPFFGLGFLLLFIYGFREIIKKIRENNSSKT